jgi:hypothetical protein
MELPRAEHLTGWWPHGRFQTRGARVIAVYAGISTKPSNEPNRPPRTALAACVPAEHVAIAGLVRSRRGCWSGTSRILQHDERKDIDGRHGTAIRSSAGEAFLACRGICLRVSLRTMKGTSLG